MSKFIAWVVPSGVFMKKHFNEIEKDGNKI